MPDLGQTRDRTIEFFYADDTVQQLPQRSSGDPLILAKWKITNTKSEDVLWHIDQAWTSFVGRVLNGSDFGRYGSFTSADGIDWNEQATSSFNNTVFAPKSSATHGAMVFGDELFIGIGGRVNSGDTAPGEVKEAITLFRISLPINNSIARLL